MGLKSYLDNCINNLEDKISKCKNPEVKKHLQERKNEYIKIRGDDF